MLYLAADHAGFELKEKIKAHLAERGIDFEDMGAYAYNKDDDYPDFAYKAAVKLANGAPEDRAIVICGSGVGVAITANKVKGVYCAQVWSKKISQSVREHNTVNAIALGAHYISDKDAFAAIDAFLSSPGATAERHKRRFGKVKDIENETLELQAKPQF